jgi:hypothetical protein
VPGGPPDRLDVAALGVDQSLTAAQVQVAHVQPEQFLGPRPRLIRHAPQQPLARGDAGKVHSRGSTPRSIGRSRRASSLRRRTLRGSMGAATLPAAHPRFTGSAQCCPRLRHAGIAHAVDDGWTLAQIRAKSRRSSLRALEVYANPSAAAIRAMTDALGRSPARRAAAGSSPETA